MPTCEGEKTRISEARPPKGSHERATKNRLSWLIRQGFSRPGDLKLILKVPLVSSVRSVLSSRAEMTRFRVFRGSRCARSRRTHFPKLVHLRIEHLQELIGGRLPIRRDEHRREAQADVGEQGLEDGRRMSPACYADAQSRKKPVAQGSDQFGRRQTFADHSAHELLKALHLLGRRTRSGGDLYCCDSGTRICFQPFCELAQIDPSLAECWASLPLRTFHAVQRNRHSPRCRSHRVGTLASTKNLRIHVHKLCCVFFGFC